MPGGEIYQHWANATPTIAFPFNYQDKKVGKIVQTWGDVRSGIQRDAVSLALPFCTSHITPSTLQANIIHDSIKKENSFQKRWNARSESRSAAGSPCSAAGLTSSSVSSLRSSIRSAQELDALANTEGGRGRAAYLKLRLKMNPQDRYNNRIRTSSQSYGWNLTPSSNGGSASRTQSAMSLTTATSPCRHHQAGADELTAALEREKKSQVGHDSQSLGLGMKFKGDTNKNPLGDYRRKDSLKALSRSSGVFPDGR